MYPNKFFKFFYMGIPSTLPIAATLPYTAPSPDPIEAEQTNSPLKFLQKPGNPKNILDNCLYVD